MSEDKKKGGGLEALLTRIHPATSIQEFVVKDLQFEPYFVIAVLLLFFFGWMPTHLEASYYVGLIFFFLMIFTLPFLLGTLAWDAWFEYQRQKRYRETDYCLLEIRLPEEIQQSPYAMELVLRGLYQTGLESPVDYYLGASIPWFSLEITSDEGRVRFYIWGRRQFKTLMENQIYAHYPTVQVVEVPDYTLAMPFDPAAVAFNGIELRLQKPDPYPIVTYNELETLKAETKEEFKHDPLASLIEFLGSVKEGEHLWVQYIIRAHEQASYCPWAQDFDIHEHVNIEQWSKKEIDKITESVTEEKEDGGSKKKRINFMGLTQGNKDKIQAMEYKLNKQLFEVGVRGVFIAHKDKAVTSPRVGLASAFRVFEHGSEGRGLNGMRPVFWVGPFNYPWQDFMNIRRHMLWKRLHDAYVTRQYFFPPHKHRWIVLNSEELATLYHFPGQVVHTPTLERLPSRRGEAPANLPV